MNLLGIDEKCNIFTRAPYAIIITDKSKILCEKICFKNWFRSSFFFFNHLPYLSIIHDIIIIGNTINNQYNTPCNLMTIYLIFFLYYLPLFTSYIYFNIGCVILESHFFFLQIVSLVCTCFSSNWVTFILW